MSTVTVTNADGKKNDVAMLSEEDIDRLQSDSDPKSRKVIVDHLKALGRPVSEIIKMKEPERKSWILERYAELAGGTKGAKPATAAKGKLTSVKSAPAAAAKTQAQDDDDDDSGSTPAATSKGGAGSSAELLELKKLLLGLGEQVLSLTNALAETSAELAETKNLVEQQTSFLLDTHFIVRTCAPISAGIEVTDLPELQAEGYGILVIEPEAAADEGND